MCGDLRESHIGQEVVLFGWVSRNRDLGGMIFVDLRDRAGVCQVRFDPDLGEETFKQADSLRMEWCIGVRGTVLGRGDNTNSDLSTGAIEVMASDIHVFSVAQTPPFLIRDETDANEMLRLEYRYLDLRRPKLQQSMIVRSKVNQIVRNYLVDNGFLEVETPILTRSTPEGARDYLVPSRRSEEHTSELQSRPHLVCRLLLEKKKKTKKK